MKIYNKIVLDKDNNIIEEDSFEYTGPITYCGGGGGSSSDSDSAPSVSYTGTTSAVDYDAMDNEAQAEADLAATHAETYSGPSADSYSGMDNEQQAEHDRQHYQSWVEETQQPQYDGTEDNEEQAEIDRQFAIDKGLITVDAQGNEFEGPNVRNDQGIIVSRNDPSVQQQDLTFAEHWANRPAAIKWSPTLSFLYATGKNIGEWTAKKGWGSATGTNIHKHGGGDGDNESQMNNESQMMRDVAPHAPYIVSGTTKPTNSPAANWFSSSLGNTSLSGSNFSMATEYAAAKAKQKSILGSPSPVGQMAVNNSPFYSWLKERSLNKGIL